EVVRDLEDWIASGGENELTDDDGEDEEVERSLPSSQETVQHHARSQDESERVGEQLTNRDSQHTDDDAENGRPLQNSEANSEDSAGAEEDDLSIEHQEKVLSYLDDLPDVEGTIMPPESHQKPHEPARKSSQTLSQQPTVEDYKDTPLKPRSLGSSFSASTVIYTVEAEKENMPPTPGTPPQIPPRSPKRTAAKPIGTDRIAELEAALLSAQGKIAQLTIEGEERLEAAFDEYEAQLDEQDREKDGQIGTLQEEIAELGRSGQENEAAWKTELARVEGASKQKLDELEITHAKEVQWRDERLRDAAQEAKEHTAKLGELLQRNKTQEQELQLSRRLNEELDKKLSASEEGQSDLVKDLRDQLAMRDTRIAELERMANYERIQPRHADVELSGKLSEMERSLSRLVAISEDAATRLKGEEDRHCSTRADLQAVRRQLDDANEKLSDVQNSLVVALKDADDLREQKRVLKEELEEELDSAHRENDRLQNANNDSAGHESIVRNLEFDLSVAKEDT
ncbi:hypothetical protein LTS18_013014, partial [Coniosporium uncinatum]